MHVAELFFYHQMFFMILCCIPTNTFSMEKNFFISPLIFEETALRNAASNNNTEKLNLLLQNNNLNIDAQNPFSGDTALIIAARKGNLNAGKFLLQAGASITIENNKQETPLRAGLKTAVMIPVNGNRAELIFLLTQYQENQPIGQSPIQPRIGKEKNPLLAVHAMTLKTRVKELTKYKTI